MPNQEPAVAWPFGNGPVRVGTQGLFRPCLKTFVAPVLPARLTAPGSPRMEPSVFSATWPASMQICWNKRKCLHKKRVQLKQDWFGTQTGPPLHCFGKQVWPPWRYVKTHNQLRKLSLLSLTEKRYDHSLTFTLIKGKKKLNMENL